ncbi:hypothetical protein AJ80_09850, partial [Polytolypa hystricis UAMH7299]
MAMPAATNNMPPTSQTTDGLAPPLREVQEFEASLLAEPNDAGKFEQCVEKRDDLLEKHDGIETLIAAYEKVMSSQCKLYKEQKELCQQHRQDKTKNISIEQWGRFIGVAAAGENITKGRLNALTQVSKVWDRKRMQHYGWYTCGERYCKVLAAAANKVPDWSEATKKLNRLILRRIEIPGRRLHDTSKNPISQTDLENLKLWTDKNPYIKAKDPEGKELPYQELEKLPDGFGFDEFGLVVRSEFATVPGPDGNEHTEHQGGGHRADDLKVSEDSEASEDESTEDNGLKISEDESRRNDGSE